jgi:enoyl-[acyl-carrier protein] reductase I
MNEISPSPVRAGQTTLMAGKRGLIMGVANERSLAWGIASVVAAHGATLAFSYQGEALGKRVRPLAESVGSTFVELCDVGDDASLDLLFAAIEREWGGLDFVVHAIGFADKDDLKGTYLKTSRANFHLALDISAYSFTAVAQRAAPLMRAGGSMLTLSYLGA